MTAKHKSLFKVNEPIGDIQERLLRRYSRYKHGSALDAEWFASRLTAMVEKELRLKSNVVLANPPFSTIPPAIMPVCKIVAKKTGVPLVILKTSVGSLSSQNYATLRTVAERKRANSTMKLAVSRIARLRGKTVFLIEDAINTGATAERVKHLLLSDAEATSVQVYSLIRLVGDDPSLEGKVNTYILKDKSKRELVQILEAPNSNMGRYLIKSLFLMPEYELMQLTAQLPAQVIAKLCKNATLYFSDHSQDSTIGILLNARRLELLSGKKYAEEDKTFSLTIAKRG